MTKVDIEEGGRARFSALKAIVCVASIFVAAPALAFTSDPAFTDIICDPNAPGASPDSAYECVQELRTHHTPGPLMAAGAPALLAVGIGGLLIRRRRQNRKS